jgi:hypothetical protein
MMREGVCALGVGIIAEYTDGALVLVAVHYVIALIAVSN